MDGLGLPNNQVSDKSIDADEWLDDLTWNSPPQK